MNLLETIQACEPLAESDLQDLNGPELVPLFEKAWEMSISIEVTNTRLEPIAEANLAMLRKEILRRLGKSE